MKVLGIHYSLKYLNFVCLEGDKLQWAYNILPKARRGIEAKQEVMMLLGKKTYLPSGIRGVDHVFMVDYTTKLENFQSTLSEIGSACHTFWQSVGADVHLVPDDFMEFLGIKANHRLDFNKAYDIAYAYGHDFPIRKKRDLFDHALAFINARFGQLELSGLSSKEARAKLLEESSAKLDVWRRSEEARKLLKNTPPKKGVTRSSVKRMAKPSAKRAAKPKLSESDERSLWDTTTVVSKK